MKAQFKYAFMAGLPVRLGLFLGSIIFFLVFGFLGLSQNTHIAVYIVGISIGGTLVGAMMAVNVVGDIFIARRLFAAPGAYLYALTPAPRSKALFASVVSMMVMDIVTMFVVIYGEVLLAFNLANMNNMVSGILDVWYFVPEVALGSLLLIAGYFFLVLLIFFCIAMAKSVFYNKPASGLLVFLLVLGCVYISSLLNLLLIPFSAVFRHGMYFMLMPSLAGNVLYILLLFAQAAVLFVLTSKLLERKINI